MTRLFIIVSFLFYSCSDNNVNTYNTIIPKPVHQSIKEGFFNLSEKTEVIFDSTFENEASYVKSELLINYGKNKNVIQLIKNKSLKEEEYFLSISKNKILIEASTAKGQMHGIQSIRQLIPRKTKNNTTKILIKCMEIHDYPKFKWRGLLLDCCRHFMEKDFVKKYIDLLAYHKMNVLHWHLTEDQGWRIEIDKYPKLTEIGAWRKDKNGDIYGGYYSKEDIREIVEYAKTRHIEIIPEIELPGHSVAAIASYPNLSCTGKKINVETDWGVFKDIYCAGEDSVFTFLEGVLSEVVELFPSKYIHIGGDEAPKYRWENCSKCQKRILENKLKDEHELQSYFIQRIEKFLAKKGKKIIGWDEIIDGGIPENAVVQSWRGTQGGITAAENQHYAIMSPTSHCYFDYDLEAINLEKVYSFSPIPNDLDTIYHKYILGGECNMWSERAPQEKVDSKVFPRILAMSEVLWGEKEDNYDNFLKRVEKHYLKLEYLGVKYGYEKTPIKFTSNFNNDRFEIKIDKGNKNMNIIYQINDNSWQEYKKPIKLYNSAKLNAKEKNSKIKEAAFKSLEINFHKGLGKKTIYNTHYNDSYQGSGNNSLINGISGSELNFRDGQWQGFFGKNVDIVIDLEETTSFNELKTSFFQYHLSWILIPKSVEYLISDDGIDYTSIYKSNNICNPMREGKFKEHFVFNKNYSARYVRVIAENYGFLPKEHPAAGAKSWLFIDEFIIK